ncbi:MAG TPA: hypothetical protein VG222_15450 [Vicinamibacterales bacterium]|jgi:hypothetical protein|nr:hypothetical protein [Vicinamibacterales bacterium]
MQAHPRPARFSPASCLAGIVVTLVVVWIAVALLYYPLNPAKLTIDRVIAIEGDTLRIIGGDVYVNDKRFADDQYVRPEYRSHDNWGPSITP